jgi:hypothetical protein
MTARAALVLLCVGCGSRSEQETPSLRIDVVSIESDVELVPEPGLGAALHVEYASGGTWRALFTCDTEVSGYACDYDMIASVEPPLYLTVDRVNEFEPEDYWYRIDRGAVHVLALTAFDEDEVTLRSEAGAALRVDLLLDGFPVRQAVVWAAEGRVRTSAPTLPLEFLPDDP